MPHLISLFRQDKAARQVASENLLAVLGVTGVLQEWTCNALGPAQGVGADPFCKLLDGGARAPATAAFASQVSQSFR